MKMKKLLTAAAAIGMSFALSVNAFAAGNGSITGIIENEEADYSKAEVTDDEGNAVDTDTLTLSILDEFISQYFSTEEGAAVMDDIEAVNDALDAGEDVDLTESFPELVIDDSVKEIFEDLQFLTGIKNVVIKDQDGNVVKNGKNITINVDITNIPADKDIAVLKFDKATGWTITKVTKGTATAYAAPFLAAAINVRRVMRDIPAVTLDGTTLSISFDDIDGAAFAILYLPKNTSDEPSVPTGDASHAVPAVAAVLGLAVVSVIAYKKKRA